MSVRKSLSGSSYANRIERWKEYVKTKPGSAFSDLPDGPTVEKGGTAEVIRRNNDPSAVNPPFAFNRSVYTCLSAAGCPSQLRR